MPNNYPPEFRRQMVELVRAGATRAVNVRRSRSAGGVRRPACAPPPAAPARASIARSPRASSPRWSASRSTGVLSTPGQRPSARCSPTSRAFTIHAAVTPPTAAQPRRIRATPSPQAHPRRRLCCRVAESPDVSTEPGQLHASTYGARRRPAGASIPHALLRGAMCRHELLGDCLPWNGRHLRHTLRDYEPSYNQHRTIKAWPKPPRCVPSRIRSPIPSESPDLNLRRRGRLCETLHEYLPAA